MTKSWLSGTHGCRWCSGLAVDEKNSLASKCPEVAKLWDKKRNGKLTPNDVTVKSNKKAWFRCGKPKHIYDATIANVVASFEEHGTFGCKFCRGRAAAPDNCLRALMPELARAWHPTKNKDLTPSDVTLGSSKVVIWKCEQGHDWPSPVVVMMQIFRTGAATKGCPYCSGKKATKMHNLFDEYPEAAKAWDPELNLPTKPWDVLPRSNKIYHWRCGKHKWKSTVSNVVKRVKEGRPPCPKCSRNAQWNRT